MITLAFAQMLYYLIMSFKALGGDDGDVAKPVAAWVGTRSGR